MAGLLDASLTWSPGPEVLARQTVAWGKRLLDALEELGRLFADRIQAAAQRDAPWTDRTSHARQGLTGRCERIANGIVIVLFHAVSYGIWLEVANAGAYAAILPALEANYAPLMAAITRLVK
ncbi:MAG TPA: hypothetical protein VH475_23170 [Tepidisphaeraceae bacterium]|jgi:hypothetical protein